MVNGQGTGKEAGARLSEPDHYAGASISAAVLVPIHEAGARLSAAVLVPTWPMKKLQHLTFSTTYFAHEVSLFHERQRVYFAKLVSDHSGSRFHYTGHTRNRACTLYFVHRPSKTSAALPPSGRPAPGSLAAPPAPSPAQKSPCSGPWPWPSLYPHHPLRG